MASIRNVGWCRIEGNTLSGERLKKKYGTLINIPSDEQVVYYGNPEIQINNPTSDVNSAVYTIRDIRSFFDPSINTIKDLDTKWLQINNNIKTWMQTNTIDTSLSDTLYYRVGQPFTVEIGEGHITGSFVIFYDDSSKASAGSTGSKYSYYTIVLLDTEEVPQIVGISAEYKGGPIPVGEEIDTDQIEVLARYNDGNQIKIVTGYTISPDDLVVTSLGANSFEVSYIDAEDELNTTSFIVQGIRNLQSISGYWDGETVPYGKEADRAYFVVIAHYTDDTEGTITNFEFPNGNTVTKNNNGIIDIYYKGRTCQIEVPAFEVKQSRLIAVYNGPQVEVGRHYQKSYVKIKIYYASGDEISKSYYEEVDQEYCTFDETLVSKQGPNSFNVSFEGQLGEITTSFIVQGFIPEIKPVDMDVEYTGSNVYQNHTINLEKIICNVYYNNGTIKRVKNFTVSTNIIKDIGPNEITVTYDDNGDIVSGIIYVNGIEEDSTTGNNIFPTSLTNNYPKASILNNRYRGPAEGVKTNNYARMITQNLRELYSIFAGLESQYNQIVDNIAGENSTKMLTLNNIIYTNNQLDNILNDDHYSTGTYKTEDVNEIN